MIDTPKISAYQTSRRQLISLTGGTAASLLRPSGVSSRQATDATPLPGADATPGVVAGSRSSVTTTLASDASPDFKVVAEAVMAAMEQFQVPGGAIGLLSGDREEHASFGVESLSSMRPVSEETLFQAGSITKTVTATAIWRLIDEGALDLDAPVQTYLPDLMLQDAEVAEQVAVRNLLDHSAGWYGDEGFDTGEDDRAIARYVQERLPVLPQIYPLGAYFSYNNAGFTMLGRLIEVCTGLPYDAAIHHMLLGPLGMDQSFLDHAAILRRPYADGHAAMPINGRSTVAVMTPLWVPRSVVPAGGIWSTTRDLLRYIAFHMNGETVASSANIVSEESLALMQEPAIDVPGLPMQMGMDWFSQTVDGIKVIFHNGDTLGQHAALLAIPEHQWALAVLVNGQGGGIAVATAALEASLSQVPALSSLAGKVGFLAANTARDDQARVKLSTNEQAEYAGRYADPGLSVTLALTDDGIEATTSLIEQPGSWQPDIFASAGPPVVLDFLEKDMAVVGHQRLPFIRDERGKVGWVSVGLRLVPRVDE